LVPLLLSVAEFDPGFLAAPTYQLAEAVTRRDGRPPPVLWLKGHNHVSTVFSFGTGDDHSDGRFSHSSTGFWRDSRHAPGLRTRGGSADVSWTLSPKAGASQCPKYFQRGLLPSQHCGTNQPHRTSQRHPQRLAWCSVERRVRACQPRGANSRRIVGDH
jgi:hypothetical protein